AHGALTLRHPAAVGLDDLAFRLALLLALHAVELAAVGVGHAPAPPWSFGVALTRRRPPPHRPGGGAVSPSAAPPASGPRPTLAERRTAACHESPARRAFVRGWAVQMG